MPLRKGFLRPQPIINSSMVGAGVAVGTIFSFALYGLFYYFRETIRTLTGFFNGGLLVELSPPENFFYNHFYGAIAAILGLHVIIKFVVENSISYRHPKIKHRQRHILNEQAFFGWSFLHGFARLTSLIGIWFLSFPFQFEIDFLREFPLLLALIPAVLFLSVWPSILRAMGRGAYRWLGYSVLYVAVLSMGYANTNWIDYQQVDKHIKAFTPTAAHDLQLPLSNNHQQLTSPRLADQIYVVQDTSPTARPVLLWEDEQISMTIGEVNQHIADSRRRIGRRGANNTVNLIIDRRIPLAYVRQLKQILRKAQVDTVQYATGIKHSRYPSYYPPLKHRGLRQPLPTYYPSLETFLDSTERLDFSRRRLKLPPSPMYRVPEVRKRNRLEVSITADTLLLNQQTISEEALRRILHQFVRQYAPDYVLIYQPDENISYGRYVEGLDLLYSAIEKVRQEVSFRLYNHPFEQEYGGRSYDTIEATYPKNVLEWTPEEERLLRLERVGR